VSSRRAGVVLTRQDAIGRGLPAEALPYDFAAAARRLGFTFVRTEVPGIDLQARQVLTSGVPLSFDERVPRTLRASSASRG
jgi:hypothetical protein